MQAIETQWRGYRFRSRLEARWAVFFDSMGIEFWYEPEGYRFQDGTMYLPDFYLPVVRMYGEVKPDIPTADELHKAECLSDGSRRSIVFLVGPPDYRHYPCIWAPADGLASLDGTVSLDTWSIPKHYLEEKRLYGNPAPGERDSFETTSERYRAAVAASRLERFGAATGAA